MVKGVLKKLPFIGALLGGGMIANAFMKDEDPNATPDEKAAAKADKWGTVGGVAGGVVGAAVGSLLGPVGTIVGGIVGDYIGSAMGEWLSTVDFAAVATTVSDTFSALASGAMDLASSAFDSVKGAWNGLVESGAKVFTGMSDWAKDTWKAATDAVMGIKDTVADKVQTAKDYVGDKATSVKDAGQNLLNKATGGKYTGGSNAAKDEMIKAMDAGGITDPKSKAMLMANVDHESGGFKKNEENLNYSAKRLQEVFPKYYKTPEDARADANNPEAIANKVYGGRMGNTEAGDGYKYRGRGNLQLTGKAQYAEMGKKLGIDLVNNPDLAMDPKYSAQIAVQHWKSSGADKAAQAGDQTRARKLTNGGTNGLEDVNSKYDAYLAQAKAGDLTPTRRADEGKVQAPAAASTAIASTMATVKGAPTGAKPITPGMPGANTVGIMAAPATAPTLATKGVTSISPVSAGTLVAPRYTPPAPEAAQMKIPATPAVEKPMMMANKPAAPTTIQMSVPLSQNLEDRQIAHVAGGGVGMG
jgi:predicted chitinase